MPTPAIRIRRMLPEDASAVAALHAEGIPQGFLSRLGARFRGTMYRGIASAPRSGVWVAIADEDRVVGFISGSAHVGRCYRAVLLRRGACMALHALPTLVSPRTWKHVFETLAYPAREIDRAPSTESGAESTAELLSIVVAPSARGTGAASALISALEAGLTDWGHRGPYRVVTMAADPRSNAFYVKAGFRLVRRFTHHGIGMNLYHKHLGD